MASQSRQPADLGRSAIIRKDKMSDEFVSLKQLADELEMDRSKARKGVRNRL